MAAVLANAGHDVLVADLGEDVVHKINMRDHNYIEPGLNELLKQVNISATIDLADAAKRTEVSFIVVPTPSDENNEFSTFHVEDAICRLGKGISGKIGEHTVVLTSTVMPGACEKLMALLERASERKIGSLLNFCYSPEFIALGSVIEDMKNPDFVLIGEATKRSGDVLSFIYQSYLLNPTIIRGKPIDAEIGKLAINCYLTMKISYANTLSEFCESFPGANVRHVCQILGADSRIGPKLLGEGTAAAGPCLPRDLKALERAMAVRGVRDELVRATIAVNQRQVQRLKMKVSGCRTVAVLGIAYKPNTTILDASVGLALMSSLERSGVTVQGYDPLASFDDSRPTIEAALDGVDAAIITAPHPEFATFDFGDLPVIDCFGIATTGTNIQRLGIG